MADRDSTGEAEVSPPSGVVPPGPVDARAGDDRELGVGRLFGLLVALALVLGTAGVVCLLLYRAFQGGLEREDPPPSPVPEARERVLPPEPRLQESPPRDMAELRAREDAVLSSYGVVDGDAGTVRIPIERAIDLAARGVRAAPGPEVVPQHAPPPPGREPSTPGDLPDGGAP